MLEMGELGFVPKSVWFPSSWFPPHSVGSGLQNLGSGNHPGQAGQEKQDWGATSSPTLSQRSDMFMIPKFNPAGAAYQPMSGVCKALPHNYTGSAPGSSGWGLSFQQKGSRPFGIPSPPHPLPHPFSLLELSCSITYF